MSWLSSTLDTEDFDGQVTVICHSEWHSVKNSPCDSEKYQAMVSEAARGEFALLAIDRGVVALVQVGDGKDAPQPTVFWLAVHSGGVGGHMQAVLRFVQELEGEKAANHSKPHHYYLTVSLIGSREKRPSGRSSVPFKA